MHERASESARRSSTLPHPPLHLLTNAAEARDEYALRPSAEGRQQLRVGGQQLLHLCVAAVKFLRHLKSALQIRAPEGEIRLQRPRAHRH